jgi:hypothetical protein
MVVGRTRGVGLALLLAIAGCAASGVTHAQASSTSANGALTGEELSSLLLAPAGFPVKPTQSG